MSYEDIRKLEVSEVASPTTTETGMPCVGMKVDDGVFLQIRKASASFIDRLAEQMRTDPEIMQTFNRGQPVKSIVGPAANVAKSHQEGRLILESNPDLVGLYVNDAVAETMHVHGVTSLDFDFDR
ncbi:MAG: hypothetical protein AAB373_05385 [Patescibacteria group bacterium]